MRLLLDTHIVLWSLAGSRSISAAAEEAIARSTDVYFSTVSFAEVGVKVAAGKLTVPPDFREQVIHSGVSILRLEAQHGLAVGELPLHHRDPFDRLLIAQARSEGLTILTADRQIFDYELATIDAR